MSKEPEKMDKDEFSLDAILAEFGSGTYPTAGEETQAVQEDTAAASPAAEEEPGPEEAAAEQAGETEERSVEEGKRESPAPKRSGLFFKLRRKAPKPPAPTEKVIEFPTPETENPVAAGIDQLRRRADDFAEHMYEDEGKETEKAVRKAERLIPGVDREARPPRERKPRRERPAPPDKPPVELYRKYGKGLKGMRARRSLVFLLFFPAAYLTMAGTMGWYLPEALTQDPVLQVYALALVQALALLLSADVVVKALLRPFQGRTGLDLMTVCANLAALADAVTLPTLAGAQAVRRPFCAAGVLSLFFLLWGELRFRQGQRLACRTAGSASQPYLVTRDEGKWNGRDTYAKWSGPPQGFGSQIQGANGDERIYRLAVPVLLLMGVVFAVISSLGRKRPEDFLWCLAAILTAAAPLSASLCYSMPWRRMAFRLAKSGAALAGWKGVTNTTGGANVLLTDIDLFPAGAVTLNGVKVFGDVSVERVVSMAATVIRDSGSGLTKVFYDLLRSQGGIYRKGEQFTVYEGGGASEIIRDQQVLVGSANFMSLMDVPLPQGLKVKNAVFCAIDGDLAGIFALKYNLPGTVAPAIDSLIRNKLIPVLATRDFNLIPANLQQRFKLPADKMEFPAVERRRELSDEEQEHSDTLTAVLCREGLGPYAEAVVGGRRLRTAVRLAAVMACIGCVTGALLAFYLTFVAAYASLTPENVILFLLMWLVPTPLIAGWVDRY